MKNLSVLLFSAAVFLLVPGVSEGSDGSIVAWGHNNYGQCDVPAPNSNFVAVAPGNYHNLGLRSDGTIVAWGSNTHSQCGIPAPNANFVAVAASSTR